ncbi:MAG TPA: TonB-dependent receptor [Acidisarcina sp.]|nr:TonB-dependent receptor [Acidisarcina sp.]
MDTIVKNLTVKTAQTKRLRKWDQNFTSKDRFSLRYGYWERIELRSLNGMPGATNQGAEPHGERSHTFATEWVHTFSPTLLLDFRASVTARNDYWFDGPTGFNQTSLGWTGAQVSQFGVTSNHFPKLDISEFSSLGNSGGSSTVGNSMNLFPSVTWIKGRHTLHAGLDMRLLQSANVDVYGGPYFWTDRQWTQSNYIGWLWTQDSGNSIASMLLGTATSGNETIQPQAFWSQHYYAPFVQDDWKVTPRLTLNLGIRYDLNGPQLERHNRSDYAFDMNATNPVNSLVNSAALPGGVVKGGVTFMGVNGNPRSLYPVVKTNIQPRVGFAYAIDDKTVFRGGFGEMFRNPTPGGNQLGWYAQTNYDATLDGGKHPYQSLSNPFPTVVQPKGSSQGMLTGLGQGPWFINPHYKAPAFWSYSLGFQRQFLSHDTVEVSYVGSKTYNDDSNDNINHQSLEYYKKCNVQMGGDPSICDNDYPTNPFYHVAGFEGTSYYTAKTIQGGNLIRPYAAFGDILEWQLNDGTSWFNSLQVTAMHKWSDSLTLHGTWTWSKAMQAGGFADKVYRIPYRAISGNDRTHRITISGVYLLPVGRGRKFLGSSNRLVDTAIGGWELGSLYVYETGWPWRVPGNPSEQYIHNAWVPRKVDPSTGYIRGVEPCVAKYARDKSGSWSIQPMSYSKGCGHYDFMQVPEYGAHTNTVDTGIRVPNNHQFDANLSKNFAIVENIKLQFRLEAFNVLNHPLWQENYTGSANDPNFGTIQRGSWGQSNLPRQMQLALKLMW